MTAKDIILREVLDRYDLESWSVIRHQQQAVGNDLKEVLIRENDSGEEIFFTYLPGATLALSGQAMNDALLAVRPDVWETWVEKQNNA